MAATNRSQRRERDRSLRRADNHPSIFKQAPAVPPSQDEPVRFRSLDPRDNLENYRHSWLPPNKRYAPDHPMYAFFNVVFYGDGSVCWPLPESMWSPEISSKIQGKEVSKPGFGLAVLKPSPTFFSISPALIRQDHHLDFDDGVQESAPRFTAAQKGKGVARDQGVGGYASSVPQQTTPSGSSSTSEVVGVPPVPPPAPLVVQNVGASTALIRVAPALTPPAPQVLVTDNEASSPMAGTLLSPDRMEGVLYEDIAEQKAKLDRWNQKKRDYQREKKELEQLMDWVPTSAPKKVNRVLASTGSPMDTRVDTGVPQTPIRSPPRNRYPFGGGPTSATKSFPVPAVGTAASHTGVSGGHTLRAPTGPSVLQAVVPRAVPVTSSQTSGVATVPTSVTQLPFGVVAESPSKPVITPAPMVAHPAPFGPSSSFAPVLTMPGLLLLNAVVGGVPVPPVTAAPRRRIRMPHGKPATSTGPPPLLVSAQPTPAVVPPAPKAVAPTVPVVVAAVNAEVSTDGVAGAAPQPQSVPGLFLFTAPRPMATAKAPRKIASVAPDSVAGPSGSVPPIDGSAMAEAADDLKTETAADALFRKSEEANAKLLQDLADDKKRNANRAKRERRRAAKQRKASGSTPTTP